MNACILFVTLRTFSTIENKYTGSKRYRKFDGGNLQYEQNTRVTVSKPRKTRLGVKVSRVNSGRERSLESKNESSDGGNHSTEGSMME